MTSEDSQLLTCIGQGLMTPPCFYNLFYSLVASTKPFEALPCHLPGTRAQGLACLPHRLCHRITSPLSPTGSSVGPKTGPLTLDLKSTPPRSHVWHRYLKLDYLSILPLYFSLFTILRHVGLPYAAVMPVSPKQGAGQEALFPRKTGKGKSEHTYDYDYVIGRMTMSFLLYPFLSQNHCTRKGSLSPSFCLLLNAGLFPWYCTAYWDGICLSPFPEIITVARERGVNQVYQITTNHLVFQIHPRYTLCIFKLKFH